MDPIERVYYFSVDANGHEIGEPILVDLAADGSANLDRLPESLRSHLEAAGVPDELHQGQIFSKDGARFLVGLLHSANPYRRFRSKPEFAN
jgi:hypothetical protein